MDNLLRLNRYELTAPFQTLKGNDVIAKIFFNAKNKREVIKMYITSQRRKAKDIITIIKLSKDI